MHRILFYHTLLMRWLRRGVDLSQAIVRLSKEADITRVSRLLRDGGRRYYGLGPSDLPELLGTAHAVLVESGNGEIWAVAVAGKASGETTWLRALALTRGVDVPTGMRTLLPPLHNVLRARALRHIFYAGDEAADTWMIPALYQQHYVLDTRVVVYEKQQMTIPSWGNTAVRIRPALPSDRDCINALDHVCFEVQWTKGYDILTATVAQGTFFVVAELGPHVVGYAYATSHFDGRLLHLVRIAVDPRLQGRAIGVRLLAEVIEAARRQHANLVTLNTQAYNLQAQRLYHWFGFVLTNEQQEVLRYDL